MKSDDIADPNEETESATVTVTIPNDPVLMAQVQEMMRSEVAALDPGSELDARVNARPLYVFAASDERREPDEFVLVSNGFEEVTGTVIRKLSDAAYSVNILGVNLVVHEPEEAWK